MKKLCILIVLLVASTSLMSCSFSEMFFQKKIEQDPPQKIEETSSIKDVSFSFKVDSPIIYINDVPVELEVPVQEIDGRTMLPLSFFKDFCNMKNVAYDPKNEIITFSMPIDQSLIPTENIGFSEILPGVKNEWYTTEYNDPFIGNVSISIVVMDSFSGLKANELVALDDPLNQIPGETQQYTIAKVKVKLISLESTDNYPIDTSAISFLLPDDNELHKENIIKDLNSTMETVMREGQVIEFDVAVLAENDLAPILVFLNNSQSPIYISLK
ncbi:MAG: hypothetical protein KAH01_05140 [Caldisericia bacterium]|nr:hypothetical protein [Caldisericia bacterium]